MVISTTSPQGNHPEKEKNRGSVLICDLVPDHPVNHGRTVLKILIGKILFQQRKTSDDNKPATDQRCATAVTQYAF